GTDNSALDGAAVRVEDFEEAIEITAETASVDFEDKLLALARMEAVVVFAGRFGDAAIDGGWDGDCAALRFDFGLIAERELQLIEGVGGAERNGVFAVARRRGVDRQFGCVVRSAQSEVGGCPTANAHGPGAGEQREFAGDDTVRVAGAATLLVIGDADVVRPGLGEAVCELELLRAAVFAECAKRFEIRIKDGDHRLELAADQGRVVLKRDLLTGADLDLVVVDIAGPRDRARQDGGGPS